MKLQKGFIQIPILIGVIIGVLIISAGGYFGYIKFKDYQIEKEKLAREVENLQQDKEKQQADEQNKQETELEKLKEEIESLKKQQENNVAKDTDLTNAEIIKKIRPAVVYIETPYGAGSGIIIEDDGYILTNAHVVKETGLIKIYLLDSRVFDVTRMATDENSDIAILKINANNLPVVEFGDSDKAQQGDEIFTFGYPFGIKGDVSFKEGTISRRLTEKGVTYIEVSAEIHPGNSGGPLVNRFGKVIGINTGKFGDSISGVLLGEAIKFAIPINIATNLIPHLKSNTKDFSSFTGCTFNKARGFITVFSSLDVPQKMIASTRFVSPSGLIFRIDENILVPAFGQITVSVTANETGPEYKIGPTTFSIPGFIGTERYTKLYGRSYQSMTCD